MKRFIISFLLVFTMFFIGCSGSFSGGENSFIDGEITNPEYSQGGGEENGKLDTDSENEEDKKKKKSYAVSTTNGLRVRLLPNTSSSTLGYLDKNDAVLITGVSGDFYKTLYKEKEAYVSSKYCSIMQMEIESDEIEKAIDIGSGLLGHPYVWGSQRYHWGNGRLNTDFVSGEFDCSALVQYVYYTSNKVILGVTSRAQASDGIEVERSQLKRGDLMFFTNESRKNKTGVERIGHVGIYFGNNYILHTASDHAVIEPISSARWGYYISARRVV